MMNHIYSKLTAADHATARKLRCVGWLQRQLQNTCIIFIVGGA